MNKIMIILAIIIAVVVYCPSTLSATMVETETITTWKKADTFNGPGNLEKEFTFTDTTYLKIAVDYTSVKGTEKFNVQIGKVVFINNTKAGLIDTTDVKQIAPGKFKLQITPGDEKDRWSVTIFERKITTNLIGNKADNKTNKGKTQKKKTSGTIIKTFNAIYSNQNRNYTVKVRRRNYDWKTINVEPYVGFADGFKPEDFNIKSQVELACHEAGWRQPVVDGLLTQIQKYMDSNGKEGFKLLEMKPGDELNWMYSGGALMDHHNITLDVGEILMRVSKYCSYYENLPETRKINSLESGDNIQAVAFKFTYKETVYVLLWFKDNLGGISQCGNLAGMSYKIKTDK